MVLGELGFQSSWRRIAINHLSSMVFLGRMKFAASIDLFRSIERYVSQHFIKFDIGILQFFESKVLCDLELYVGFRSGKV